MLEPLLAKSLSSLEPKFYFAGNPWTCNCQTIKTIQDFVEK